MKNVFDATQNIDAGARTCAGSSTVSRARVDLALAGYNAGEGAVDRHHGIPPFAETEWYVIKVLDHATRDRSVRLRADARRNAPLEKTAPSDRR